MISQLLWRNQGNVLTPDLIVGLLHGLYSAPVVDRSIPVEQFAPMEYKGYTFAVERYAACEAELRVLHKLHWEEVDERLATIPLNPDYEQYKAIDMAGGSLKFTIRQDGELVGYCLVMLYKSLHTQTMCASEDTFFMRKDHRGGFTMIRFVKWMVECLKQIHIHEIRVTSKVSNKAHVLMERAGFKPCAMQLVMMTEGDS